MSKEDLIPITTTERAKELGAMGGKVNSLAQKMINRKFCYSTCPMYNNCWAKHTSHSLYEMAIEKAEKSNIPQEEIKKIKPLCALKSLPSQVIEGTKRIILDGEEGFNNEMMEQIVRYKRDIIIGTVTPREREKYLYQLRETKKSIYGDKTKIEGLPENKGLTAEDFATAYRISKEKEEEEKKNNGDKNELGKKAS